MKTLTGLLVAAAAAVVLAGCGGEDSSEGAAPAQQKGGDAVAASLGDVAPTGVPVPSYGAGYGPGITVIGTGEASAVPDTAQWSFGVQVQAASASAALHDASEAANRIVGAVRDQGIARHDIRTEQVSIYPQTSNDGISIVGYSASSTVSVTVRDIDRAGKIVDAAVAAGGNQVYGPSLSVSDTHEAYRSAVKAALADARSRAEALAAEAGVTLGTPVAVVESGGGYPVPYAARTLAADAAAEVSIEPGVDRITANLTVTFAIGG